MFDDIKCEAKLPDGRVPGGCFQTKSLFCCMDQFTITAAGKLIFHRHQYETDGEREVRSGVTRPEHKLVHMEDIDMDYHGDIRFYGPTLEDHLVEYVARFTHGTLEWIRPYETLSETHKMWFYAKD